jgi:hypothetical protein
MPVRSGRHVSGDGESIRDPYTGCNPVQTACTVNSINMEVS